MTKTATPTPTPTTITISDRNEIKYLVALGFEATPVPASPGRLDFQFLAADDLFEARRAYSLNHSVKVLDFIDASRYVDGLIHEHRQREGVRRGR